MIDLGKKTPGDMVWDLAVYAPFGLAITVGEVFPQLVRKGRSRLGPQVALARSVGQFAIRQGARQLRDVTAQRPRLPNMPSFRFGWPGGGFGWPGGGAGARGEEKPGAGNPSTDAEATDGERHDFGDEGPAGSAPRNRPSGTVDLRARASGGASSGRTSPGHTSPGRTSPGAASSGRTSPGAASSGTGSAGGRQGQVTAEHLAIPSYDSLSASQVVQRLAGLSRDEVEAVRVYEASTRGRRTILARAEQLLA
ncbi:MAG TPA: hypothetical protein VME20_05400 [Acidimicrobiales bacterium]|nr:hypothetical protein [Acidimicrobiales bacterium]